MKHNKNRLPSKSNNRSLKPGPVLSEADQQSINDKLQQATMAMDSGNLRQSQELINRILQMLPNHPDALNIRAALLMKTGETLEAVRILTKITNLIPKFAQAHFNLGTALNALGKPSRAVKSLKQALLLNPDYAEAHYNLGNSLRQTKHIETAINHYEHCLKLNPSHVAAATNLASAHLNLGNSSLALKACELARKSDPGNRDVFSFSAIALTETGEPEKAEQILSPKIMVRPKQFDVRPGFESLKTLNQALVEHVITHKTLATEPHNKATRNGQQTGNLSLGDRGPVTELQNMIGEALDEYLATIKNAKYHPYPFLIPNLSKIDIWGTVLGNQGHQTAHMHRSAWVSGVYYAQLPKTMQDSDNGYAGWIEFGRPPDEFKCQAEHAVHLLEPKEGLLVLFPSYLYHRTIPFKSDNKRISIAFDLL